jgi:hypothetical protein
VLTTAWGIAHRTRQLRALAERRALESRSESTSSEGRRGSDRR